jgi:hypothetical protein
MTSPRLPRAVGGVAIALTIVASGACASKGGGGAAATPDASQASGSGDSGRPGAGNTSADGGSVVYSGDAAVASTATCTAGHSSTSAQSPVFVRNIPTGETGWYSSPAIIDVTGDGKPEIVAPQYSTFVFDAQGNQLSKGTATMGRVYAPVVVAELDGDGKVEIVVGGNGGTVAAYDYAAGTLATKWTADTTSDGQSPEARGMAADDLDHDGTIEVAVTTTNTASTAAQVFVFASTGALFQPAGTSWPAWPRYNTLTGPGGDANFNGAGNHGYGEYGENVGIGNIDDDPDLEIVTTYDDHQINAFKLDGTSILASSYYTDPTTQYLGLPLGWGQFIRWVDPAVEAAEYNTHTSFGDVNTTMWLQWTASPPNVVDVNGDGKNEVVGVPNAEEHTPYVTQAYAFMVLEGAYDGGSNSARRLPAFDTLPLSGMPPTRDAGDYYPPDGIPAPTTVNILGDARPEILAPINDGYVYAIGPDGSQLWRYDFANGVADTFASEVVVADLNQDGTPEIVFGTYSLQPNAGHLVVLSNTGSLLFDIMLPNQGMNGNGIGIPAAPTIGDLDGDGTLEIVVSTFDHGLDVFTVPGSAGNCLLWPTGRGNYLRNGAGPSTVK